MSAVVGFGLGLFCGAAGVSFFWAWLFKDVPRPTAEPEEDRHG